MTPTFISYSNADGYFVNLLATVLEFHRIDFWCASERLAPGESFATEIDTALRGAQSIVPVISPHTEASKWVTTEIAMFQVINPSSAVIPLLLADVSPERVAPGLSRFQSVRFDRCMRAGFQELLGRFDRKFLDDREFTRVRPRGPDRRQRADRRDGQDRRQHGTLQRLRHGCWIGYEKVTQAQRFDRRSFRMREFALVEQGLLDEVTRYRFRDANGVEVDPRRALEHCLHAQWEEDRARADRSADRYFGTFRAVYLIEAVAERLYETYEVEALDRRTGEERRKPGDRRGPPPGGA